MQSSILDASNRSEKLIYAYMKKHFLLLYFLMILLSACVSNKKVVYMQKDDLKQKEVPLDTVVREYAILPFEYRVQAQDVLSIKVESLTKEEYNFFNLSTIGDGVNNNQLNPNNAAISGELVDDEGYILFPVVGKIKVAGLTIFEAQSTIQSVAEEYLENPIVSVRLLNFRYTLLGEVNEERTVNTFNNRISIVEAIGMTAGLTDLADRSKIKLIRQVDNATQVHYLNLLDEDIMNSPYYYVHQNDIIIVPPLKQRPYRKYFGQNIGFLLSSLSTVLLAINLLTNN